MFNLFLEGEQGVGGSPIFFFVMLGVLVLVFIFTSRSQKKRDKEVNDMRENLQVGDEITTIGGIIGKIVSIKEETILVETGRDRTRIRFLRSAVRNVDVKAEDAE